MTPDFYKRESRAETARRVRERSDSVNPSRGLDEALDDRIERDETRVFGLYYSEAKLWREVPAAREVLTRLARYRNSAEALRDLVERAVPLAAHAVDVPRREEEAQRWLAEALEALKVPNPSSGSHQGRGPESSTPERKGVNKHGA